MKEYTDTHARGTGRSTRLLEQVIDAAMSKRVVVLCHSDMECRRMQREYRAIKVKNNIKDRYEPTFKTPERIHNLDWKNRKALGYDQTFIDPQVWVVYFGFAINGFHEFDNQNAPSLFDKRPMPPEIKIKW